MHAKLAKGSLLTGGKMLIFWVLCCAAGMVGASVSAAVRHPLESPRVRLRQLMTVDAYDRTGIDRLSTAQRQALEQWLAAHLHEMGHAIVSAKTSVPVTAPHSLPPPRSHKVLSPVNHFGLPPRRYRHIPGEIESRIDGVFQGWTGNTRFHLMNGQVWVQSGTGYFRIPKLIDPRIKIKKLWVGYVLKVRGYGEQVFVTRVR